jgi:hypothetical protein
MEPTTAIITTPNELSAGLYGIYHEVNDLVFVDESQRETFRKNIGMTFEELYGEPVTVMFEDELAKYFRR